ncbi:general secretion pathway protein GspB [uncultured Thiodictyon sp.]|uniref:general secretion pathway protein GspB n=1 Tax=uncultured Thiodictyon sp. TaxID=1846217 RepID=UPI0025D3E36A|nr:general secretion pathway protein GspB [uncultured Thiodictyon sp.]
MSYILEALQRSQAERELGRVPTLEGAALLAEVRAVPRPPWPLVAVVLAATAVLLALYAVLRAPPGPSAGVAGTPSAALVAPQLAPGGGQTPVDPPPTARAGALPVDLTPRSAPAGLPGPVAAGAAVPPVGMPLVEAPPPKVSRRVVADPAGTAARDAPAPPRAGAALDDADLQLELELKRQLEEDDQARGQGVESAPPQIVRPDPGPTPVPQDLISAIDAFKHRVKGGPGQPKDPGKPVPPPVVGPAPAVDPSALRLPPDQQAALPKFLMNVHVFDADPARRFVLINGLKYAQGTMTREGLTVDEIRVDGVVLTYQGHPFFVHR